MLAGPSPDTDEELTRKVLELIETEAGVKAAVSGPKVKSFHREFANE